MTKRMRLIGWHQTSALAGILLLLQISPALPAPTPMSTGRLAVVPSEKIVLTTDVDFKTWQKLDQKYGCLLGGLTDRSVNRHEFAFLVKYCRDKMDGMVLAQGLQAVSSEDFLALRELEQAYADELEELTGRKIKKPAPVEFHFTQLPEGLFTQLLKQHSTRVPMLEQGVKR